MVSAPKAAKKAPKKSVKHAHLDDHGAKDLRRAYEHLGRVEILHGSLTPDAHGRVKSLTHLAQQQLEDGHLKDAADLLRCAEHLSFADLGSRKDDKNISRDQVNRELETAATREFEHLMRKAEEHWAEQEEHPAIVENLFVEMTDGAQLAFDRRAYRPALELARGAEALAHVKMHESKKIAAPAPARRLKP